MPLRVVFSAESPSGCSPPSPEITLALAAALLNQCARAADVSEDVLHSAPRRFTLGLFLTQPQRGPSIGHPEILTDPFLPGTKQAQGTPLRLAISWLCETEALRLLGWVRTLHHSPLSVTTGSLCFRVAPVLRDRERDQEEAWVSYSAILRDASPSLRQVTLKFCTPTLLCRDGRPYPLPDPVLLFRGYLDLWNAFSGLPLSPDLGTAIDRDLQLTDFRLRRRSFGIPPGGQAAFGGSATFSLQGRHPESVLKGLNSLADFVEFCGTGTGTDRGMGLTRRVRRAASETV